VLDEKANDVNIIGFGGHHQRALVTLQNWSRTRIMMQIADFSSGMNAFLPSV
jgi:hypothetical protein